MTTDIHDPKGLIAEAFKIDGIMAPECRSIFLDWALGVPDGRDMQNEAAKLLAFFDGAAPVDHPMLLTLRAALDAAPVPQRRGGRRSRLKGQ